MTINQLSEKYEDWFKEAKRKLLRAFELGNEVLVTDATTFTSQTLLSSAWQLPNRSFALKTKVRHAKRINLLLVISNQRGVIAQLITEKNPNGKIFGELLEQIGSQKPFKTLLLLDNVSYQKTLKNREKMSQLGIMPVYNCPWSPALSAIELVFSKLKLEFKKLLLEELELGMQVPKSLTIQRAINSLDLGFIQSVYNHTNKRWQKATLKEALCPVSQLDFVSELPV